MLPVKILVAEDDLDDQIIFHDFLQHRNDISFMPMAENGVALTEFLELAKETELPQFIILDQNMPKMCGLQTLQWLKKNQRYAHIPVMIYSTYIDDLLIKQGLTMGATHVMNKPFTKEGYSKMMDAFLKTRN